MIYPIHYSTWIANIMHVWKKNREIRIYVDFQNLNQASLKDNYALPNIDHILQTIAGSKMMSMLDGFSGFSQIEVDPEDKFKTVFTTPWGTFTYNRIPFGLINARATFQRVMNSSFVDPQDRIIVIYLDDLIVFSKKREDHLRDLEKVLKRCGEHGISLNPKKSVFCITKGRFIGHIVFHECIRIDPEHVKAIQQLNLPVRKSGTKSFFGQVNFLRRFIPDFSKIKKCIIDMMKGSQSFKWNDSGKKAFDLIKHAIARAPMLVHPDYTKEFILYCYEFAHTLSAILMQENNEGIQAPITFMVKTLMQDNG